MKGIWWPNEGNMVAKWQKKMIYKTLHKILKIEQHELH
jgi:hypothetical protein